MWCAFPNFLAKRLTCVCIRKGMICCPDVFCLTEFLNGQIWSGKNPLDFYSGDARIWSGRKSLDFYSGDASFECRPRREATPRTGQQMRLWTLLVIPVPFHKSLTLLEASAARTSWHMKVEPVDCPETSVTTSQSTLRNIPEERRSHHRFIITPLHTIRVTWGASYFVGRFHPFYRPRRPLGRAEVWFYSVFRPRH
jgi:hypothetical protein